MHPTNATTKGMEPPQPDLRKLYRAVAKPAPRNPGWFNGPRLDDVRKGALGIQRRPVAQSGRMTGRSRALLASLVMIESALLIRKTAVVKGGLLIREGMGGEDV